jgi:D-arabinan endo alpha-(1,5)-arabinofuranosidase
MRCPNGLTYVLECDANKSGALMSGRRLRVVVAGVLSSVAVVLVAVEVPASAQEARVQGPAQRVAVLAGQGSMNLTELRWQVKGTDLGIMWSSAPGQVLLAFGDTLGSAWRGIGTHDLSQLHDWRSNTLARSTDPNPADGLWFDSYVTDLPIHGRELLPSKKIDHVEVTVVPTGGINVGGRDYLAYMSVRHWGVAGGRWITNHAGIAFSDDNGQTWVDVPGSRRVNTPGFDDPFQMVSFARADGFVYALGTPNGRFGSAHLARVPEDTILDLRAYQYFDGAGWQPDPRRAAPVVSGPVGEISLHYQQGLGRWLMTYLDESRHEIVLRTAPALTGPWGPEQTLAGAEQYPFLYGAFIHPASNGSDLYFTMSQFGPYNVSLMRIRLGAP